MANDLTTRQQQSTGSFLLSAQAPPTLPAGALTRAADDSELIALWLRRPNLSPRTVRNGRKEAERFLLWLRARGQVLVDVAYEDLLAYAAFLADPQPAGVWVRAERYPRSDVRWRPFCGPLSTASQLQALTVLKGLFSWARAAQYLPTNPAALLGAVRLVAEDVVSRFLPPAAIALMLLAADQVAIVHTPPGHTRRRVTAYVDPAGAPSTPAAVLRRARARFIVLAFYLTAVRLSELAGADMRSVRSDDDGAWWLHVMGKGRRRGKVPVPAALLDELMAYRQAHGLSPLPAPIDTLPLVLTSRGPLRRASDKAVAAVVKDVMRRAILLATARGDAELAHRLSQASTHWLRHTALTHQLDNGVDLKTVQLNGRHAHISTTGRYLHKEDAARHADTTAAIMAALARAS